MGNRRCGEAAQFGHAGAAVGAALQILLQPGEGRTGGDGGADLRFADLEAGADGPLKSGGAGDGGLAEELLERRKRLWSGGARGGKLEAQDDLRSLDEGQRGVIKARQPGGGSALQFGGRGGRKGAAPARGKRLDPNRGVLQLGLLGIGVDRGDGERIGADAGREATAPVHGDEGVAGAHLIRCPNFHDEAAAAAGYAHQIMI